MDTLVVNLFGGPGVSKSTNMALAFGKLKTRGINCEIASEYAKDLVWEGRKKALTFQPYIAGKQMYRVVRLFNEVDVVLTDSPILLSAIYGDNLPSFDQFLVDMFKSWHTMNIHLVRDLDHHPYNPKGRTQTLEEAQKVDDKIENTLNKYLIPHITLQVEQGEGTAEKIVGHVVHKLKAVGCYEE